MRRALMLGLVVAALLAGCGKKGPLEPPPGRNVPASAPAGDG